jgi:hypothetical protein
MAAGPGVYTDNKRDLQFNMSALRGIATVQQLATMVS